MTGLCEHLPWDTEFFGIKVARVLGSTMDDHACETILRWCTEEEVKLLYFLADDDGTSSALASASGFRMVDVRIKLVLEQSWPRLPAGAPVGSVTLREATQSDLAELLPIATQVHKDSRFFADPTVPREKASELFEHWLHRSVSHSIADVVFVAELDGHPVSYITAVHSTGRGHIGLVGVGEQARGRGIGFAMVQRVLEWFEARGVREVSVVTQGRNIMAQRVYQRCGFLTESVHLWFHRWFI